jgi:hypothetical protein
MTNDWKISSGQMLMLFGFLFFSLGTLGIIQIGILEGLSEVIPISLVILLVGIVLLLIILLRKIRIN